MRQSFIAFLLLAAAAPLAPANAPDESFDRYRPILDRKPFGSLPPPEVNVPQIPPAESFAKNLRLSMIVEPDEGPKKIGFVDGRNNKSYTLAEGESEDGIEVVSADFQNEEAILRQGSEMALVKFTSGAVTALTPEQQQQVQSPAPQQRPSYAERRRMRQQPVEPPPPEIVKPKYTGEELQKHLYNYQMEVIRQGLPPLPIPLTPEQDAQLVKEGVLPPLQ
jgi:hypothetical protein